MQTVIIHPNFNNQFLSYTEASFLKTKLDIMEKSE